MIIGNVVLELSYVYFEIISGDYEEIDQSNVSAHNIVPIKIKEDNTFPDITIDYIDSVNKRTC